MVILTSMNINVCRHLHAHDTGAWNRFFSIAYKVIIHRVSRRLRNCMKALQNPDAHSDGADESNRSFGARER